MEDYRAGCAEGVEVVSDWEKIKSDLLQLSADQLMANHVELVSLRSECDRLRAENAAQSRELERWRHGVTVEGDFVCPDSLALDITRTRIFELEQALREARQFIEDYGHGETGESIRNQRRRLAAIDAVLSPEKSS